MTGPSPETSTSSGGCTPCKPSLRTALNRKFGDFEDAVIDAAAEQACVDGIVTRDATAFAGSELPIFSPTELLQVLASR